METCMKVKPAYPLFFWIGLILLIGLCEPVEADMFSKNELIQLYEELPPHFNVAIRPRPEIAVPAANIFVFLFKFPVNI